MPDFDIGDTGQDVATIEPPLPVSGDERRMHVRAYNYWVSLLAGRAFPTVDDLDLDLTGDFGPKSVLLDFTLDPEDPAIAWLGDRLATECDLDAHVSHVSQVPPRSLLSRLTDQHLQIIANRAPIGFEAEFVNTRGNEAMYRGILLPFSSDGETIDFIYGVINWKEVAPPETQAAIAAELDASRALIARHPVVPVWADGPGVADGEPAETVPDYEPVDLPRSIALPTASEAPALALPDDDTPLGEWLDAARATADAALAADTRSRGALYQALALAYDFALLTDRRAAEYSALLTRAKIAVQARAPMTPVVKLVFGADYDKTRLTEFAAALSFARRRALPSGGMRLFLENFPGGLKAIVAADRRERRPEGRPERPDALRDAARALAEQAYLSLPGEDEFVVLIARRVDPTRVAVIGVVPDDKPLLDRALRQIVE